MTPEMIQALTDAIAMSKSSDNTMDAIRKAVGPQAIPQEVIETIVSKFQAADTSDKAAQKAGALRKLMEMSAHLPFLHESATALFAEGTFHVGSKYTAMNAGIKALREKKEGENVDIAAAMLKACPVTDEMSVEISRMKALLKQVAEKSAKIGKGDWQAVIGQWQGELV